MAHGKDNTITINSWNEYRNWFSSAGSSARHGSSAEMKSSESLDCAALTLAVGKRAGSMKPDDILHFLIKRVSRNVTQRNGAQTAGVNSRSPTRYFFILTMRVSVSQSRTTLGHVCCEYQHALKLQETRGDFVWPFLLPEDTKMGAQ